MRAIDADALTASLKKSADRCRDWIQECINIKDDVTQRVAEQSLLTFTECYLRIEKMPTIEPHEWIPCSEETGDGYPEEDGFYYVTEQNYGFYLDADYKQRVTHTSHFKNGDFTDRFYAENNSNITAWMPLPEPWRGKE